MFEAVSAPLKLWRTNSKELNIKLRKALIISLIAPIFVAISAPPSQALPITTSSTKPPTSSGEVKSPFTDPANLKISQTTTQSANLNSTGLIARFDAKTYASYTGTGTSWSDISGNGLSAAFTNKSSPLTSDYTSGGVTFKGIGFNGTNQYANINSTFSTTYTGVTVSFYADFGGTANNYERIIDIGAAAGSENILVAREGTTTNLIAEVFSGTGSQGWCRALSAIPATTTAASSRWAHYAFVFNGTTCSLYKNGSLYTGGAIQRYIAGSAAATSNTGTVAHTGLPASGNVNRANAYIGESNWSGDDYFEGAIADIAIFNRALSATDVAEWKVDQMSSTIHTGSGGCANRVANPAAATVTAVGGDCVVKFTAPSNTTTSNTWIVPSGVTTAKVLTVGGGGGGGAHVGGGGGAGGFIESITSVTATSAISISVGAGGAGTTYPNAAYTAGSAGSNSVFGSSFTSLGGGRGASWIDVDKTNGGSGGGSSSTGSWYPTGGLATNAAQGYAGGSSLSGCGSTYGYPTGGGGGAGGVGGSATCLTYSTGKAGDGGIGKISDVTGTPTYYAGGGGGGIHGSGTYHGIVGNGGLGGGGKGGGHGRINTPGIYLGANGTDGLGGGGGGSGAPGSNTYTSTGGRGGSGVVIVRYGTTTLAINSNGGSGFTGTTSFSGTTFSNITLPVQSGLTRSGFTFGGWNTAADGSGTNYSAGSVYQLNITTTLYAQWRSVISYDANGATSSRTLETTSALGSGASSTLSSGQMNNGSVVTTGLQLHLDASNPASYPGTGSTWYDLSGNNKNATALNSPIFDPVTKSFVLNGTNQYFEFPNTDFQYSGTSSYTLATMFKTSNLAKAEQCLICRYQAGTSGSYLLRLISGDPETYREGPNASFQATGKKAGSSEYDYLVTTFNGSTVKIYLNGVEVLSTSHSGSASTSTTIKTNIGRTSDNLRYFEGQIFSAQIYNVALTPEQILQNYNALLPRALVNKTSSTLAGWSTTSDTSTSVIVGSNGALLAGLPTPYIRLEAKNYDGSTWTPTNYNGNGITYSEVKPTKNTNQTGWGATATFPTVSGLAANTVAIYLNNPELDSYTFCGMARYKTNGASAPATMGRIFTGTYIDWLAGWYNQNTKDFYHSTGYLNNSTEVDYNWHYLCDSGNNIYWDGVKIPVTNLTYSKLPTIAVGGAYRDGDWSDFELTEVIVYDQFLPASQIAQINQYFKSTYGMTAGAVETATPTMVPPTNFASTGTSTLYARWGSTITYDGNGQSNGTPPTPQVFANGVGTLASNSGSLAKAGFNFVGWNTRADGTGTFYAPGASYSGTNLLLFAVYQAPVKIVNTLSASDPIALSPYMRFKASDYDATKKIWYDSSGNARNTSSVRGDPTVVTTTVGNGSTKAFQVVSGGTTAGIKFNNPEMTFLNWTVFSVARYNGTQSGYSRVFDGASGDFLFGFYNSASGVAYYNGWVTGTGNVHGTNWVLSTGYSDAYRSNGVLRGTGNGVDTLPPLTLNAGVYAASQPSIWQVAETIIFNRKLSLSEIQQVEDYLASTYGISGYSAQQSYSESITVNAASGSVTFSDTVTAILGYRNSLTLSPTIAGITIENLATNQVRLRVANTVAPGTYWETITATDTAGNTALLPIKINVFLPVVWSPSNATSAQTTYGKQGRIRLDFTDGGTNKRVTLTHVSTPSSAAITIDTSTIASNFVTILVDTSTAIGTYQESITVTDSTGVTKNTVVTITVNKSATISYPNSSSVPDISKTGLLVRYEMDSATSYSGSGTSIVDLQGRSNALLVGTATFDRGFNGNLQFTGTQYLNMRTGLTSAQMGDTISVFMWVQPKGNGIILDERGQTNSDGTVRDGWQDSQIEVVSGSFRFRTWNSSTISFTPAAGSAINTGWYYVGYVYNKSTLTFTAYVNGVVVGTPQTSFDRSSPIEGGYTQVFAIGQNDATNLGSGIKGSFGFGAFHLYGTALSAAEVLNNFLISKGRYTYLPTAGNLSLTGTAGTARDFSIFTGVNGYGTKTISLSGANSVLTVDTTTANTAILKLSALGSSTSTTSPRTYSETMTATDANGMTTPYYISLTVNPRIIITASRETITTTFGVAGTATLTATQGTGALTFTRVSGSGSSAITMSTSAGQATLTVAGTLPVGTYYETLTATDSIGATTSKVITILVNPRLLLTSNTGSAKLATTYGKATSLRLNITGGTGNMTIGIPYVSSNSAWKLTLETSTVSLGYLTLRIGAYATVGTHLTNISVTDSVGAYSNLMITTTVNENPRINGNSTSNSYTNTSLDVNLDAANSASYPGTGTTWTELSGDNGNFTFQGTPTYSTLGGGSITTGTNNYVQSVKNAPALTEFTLESWFNLSSLNTAGTYPCLISSTISSTNINYFLCLFNSAGTLSGGYYRNGWYGQVSTTSALAVNTWYHAAYKVTKAGDLYFGSLYLNGSLIGNSSSVSTAPPASAGPILIGKRWGVANEFINGRIQVARIYNRSLSDQEITANYNAYRARLVANANTPTTLTTTQGIAVSNKTIKTSLGTGDLTFELTPDLSASGISGDFSQAGVIDIYTTAGITAIDSQTARTYVETLTATDITGAFATHLVNIVINPPIIETSTAPILTNAGGVITHLLTTTSGIETSTVIFASQGTGNKSFARTGTAGSGVSLTPNGNQATLRVLSTINPGTYWETVTATDTTTASTSLAFKIVVNPGPTIIGRTTLTATTRSAYTSPGYFVANGTGALKLTMSPVVAGISLDTATAGIAYIKLTNAFTSAATYYETLTVTDANGAIGRLMVTIKVVAPVTISGNTTVVSTYGDSNLFSYNVSGSAASYNVAVAGSCITSKSTYTSGGTDYTVEQLLGANGSNTCEWVVPNGVTSVTGLVIAGGGQGGAGRGGGGGAGGVVTGTTSVTPGETLTVKVGVGGSNASCASANSPAGCDGTDSSISKSGAANYVVAKGGGGGGGHSTNYNGRAGGSGGGAGMNFDSGNSITNPPEFGVVISNTVPSGWTGYGFAGATTTDSETVANKYRNTGGGGGAASTGFPGVCANKSPVCNNSGTGGGFRPDGGNALTLDITGVTKTYAGGGGGAVALGVGETSYLSGPAGNAYTNGPLDKGNAGVGATQSSPYGTNAAPNTGSGGGGSIGNPGGNGGSGLVVFRYVTTNAAQPNNKISFALVESTTGRFNLTVPESLTVGTYTQTVIISDASDVASTSTNYTTAVITIRVIQDTPTATISLPGAVTTATYGTPVTLTSAVSTNGKVTFKKGGSNISNCVDLDSVGGLAVCSWTPTEVESAVITASLVPTDSINYRTNIENDSSLTVNVGKADTLTVTASDLSATYSVDGSGNANTTIPARSVTFTGLASIDSITAASYTFSGTLNSGTSYASSSTPPKEAGTYSITPSAAVFTSPATATNYKAVVYAPGTLTINRKARGNWDFEYLDDLDLGINKVYYGETKTLVLGLIFHAGDGTENFSTTSSTCSVDSATGTISTLNIGNCAVQVVLSQSANWLSDTKTVNVEIVKGKRTATLTPGTLILKYGETTTITASISPVLDSSTVTFSSSTTIPGSARDSYIQLGCSVDAVSGEITATKALGICYAIVEYSETDFYSKATAYKAITIRRAAAPVVTTETITAVSYTGSTAIVSPTYSVKGIATRDILTILPTADVNDLGSIPASSYSSVSSYKYVALSPHTYDSSTAPFEGGTYAVSAQGFTLSGVAMSNYESPTYVSSNLVINPIEQAPLRILLSAQESITVPYDISISGGSSTGALSAVVVSGGTSTGCSVTGLRLTTTQAGTCVLRATKAADRNYLQVLSETATVVILNFVSSFSWDTVFSGTGITITSEVPVVTGPETCSADCVPQITDVQDLSGNSTVTLTVGAPLRIVGVDLNTTERVLFTARINGARLSSVPADSFQIDSPTQLTVMPPANFVPNAGENSSTITVRILVMSPGGSINTEKIVIISL